LFLYLNEKKLSFEEKILFVDVVIDPYPNVHFYLSQVWIHVQFHWRLM